MTLEVQQAGRQELTTQAPQSSEGCRMSKDGSQLEAEVRGIGARMEGLERRQEEIVRLLNSLRSELAGISSGMARRDSLILGGNGIQQLQGFRRDSFDPSRRDSLVLGSESFTSTSRTFPVMEVEPWTPTQEVADVLDRLLERQFLLSPWVREKRLRNQLRLVLKDHLEAGPVRRSTVTKVVHDAHQVFPIWRTQIRETMLAAWDQLQEADLEDAADVIFAQFKKPRFPDEVDAGLLYAEHMIEVGQYLMRRAGEKAGRNGKVLSSNAVTNSKFWYEVRKKVNEVVEESRSKRNSLCPQDDSDTDLDQHQEVTPQSSLETEDESTLRIKSYGSSQEQKL